MNSGLKLAASPLAVLTVIAAFAGISPASAADLGGNCCADLEERIAELEATTARKGNRKVKLTVSGWVNEAVFFWDDGSDRNIYVGNNALEQSRIKFSGEAKIVDDWSAGFTLELGLQDVSSNQWDQDFDNRTSAAGGIQIRKSNWFIKSKQYGKVTVGLEGTATYHLLDDADVANTRNYSDYEAAAVAQGNFFLKSTGARFGSSGTPATTLNTLRWSDILRPTVNNGSPGQNGRRNVVRYDSPELKGFTLTASWGEDDMGGVSLTYKETWGDFKVIGKGGWEQQSDETTNPCSVTFNQTNCDWFGFGGSVMHVPTGLFVYGGYGETIDHEVQFANAAAEDSDRSWYLQAGIERKWHPLGTTTIFGEYRHDDTGSRLGARTIAGGGAATAVRDGDIDFWAAGVVQNIEAAAMDMYVIYRHAEGDINSFNGTNVQLDAFDTVMTGTRIQF